MNDTVIHRPAKSPVAVIWRSTMLYALTEFELEAGALSSLAVACRILLTKR